MSSTARTNTGGQGPPDQKFAQSVDAIEEAYEFFLAYASQGLPADAVTDGSHQIREYLKRCDAALAELGDFVVAFAAQAGLDQTPYRAFAAVIERDARDARAAIQLVLSLSAIGSQVVDNLNASIHLRALLTDLFLIDEVLKTASR